MTEPQPDIQLAIEVLADEADAAAVARASKALLNDPQIRQMFPKSDLWLVGFDVTGKGDGEPARFRTIVHDTSSGRSVRAEGPFDEPGSITIVPTEHQQPPNEEEHAWGVEALQAHMDWADVVAQEGITPYRPNPPLANIEYPDGSVERVLTIGLRSEREGDPRHRIMGIKTADGDVVAEPEGVPAPSSDECGVPRGASSVPAGERADRARVRITRAGEELPLWEFVIVRAPASSGINGSGLELRNVDYKGQGVLSRAHVPIITVEFGHDGAAAGCGPIERVWQREEAAFEAFGEDPVPGFRVCTQPPRTVADLEADTGNFGGAALWLDGPELVIVTQLQAGWHRYVNEWRFNADGTIRPRLRVAAVQNPCTCKPHVHHAYWRLDFDIIGQLNVVQEHNDVPAYGTSNWHTMRFEVHRPRDSGAGRYWRVRSARASQGYSLIPGASDGEDANGAGDLWVLRYHDSEVDDGIGLSTDLVRARAQLDRLVSGESVHTRDVVLWYAAHAPQPGPATAVGPDLVPFNWKDLSSDEPFATLIPPSA